MRLHISPCPNDTFMFAAMVDKHDTHFYDIEELNRLCIAGIPEISKISYAALPAVIENYELLDCGSALGRGNGPVFVKNPQAKSLEKIAVPGIHTTANRLLEIFYPELTDKTSLLFSEIAPAVARGDFDAGVLIHEGRFVYERLGLELVADLGELWEGLLPLGAIVVRRSLPVKVKHSIETALRESIAHAFAHPEASRAFIKRHAQEMDDAVIEAHIHTFVNDYSLTLGDDGRHAVERFTGLKIWR